MMLHMGDNVIGSVSSVLDPHQMCGLMEQQAQPGMDKMIIGATTTTDHSTIVLEDEDMMSDRSGEESLDGSTNLKIHWKTSMSMNYLWQVWMQQDWEQQVSNISTRSGGSVTKKQRELLT